MCLAASSDVPANLYSRKGSEPIRRQLRKAKQKVARTCGAELLRRTEQPKSHAHHGRERREEEEEKQRRRRESEAWRDRRQVRIPRGAKHGGM